MIIILYLVKSFFFSFALPYLGTWYLIHLLPIANHLPLVKSLQSYNTCKARNLCQNAKKTNFFMSQRRSEPSTYGDRFWRKKFPFDHKSSPFYSRFRDDELKSKHKTNSGPCYTTLKYHDKIFLKTEKLCT